MDLEQGEPVGLSTGLQAGAFLGLYLGFSLSVISVLTDPTQLARLGGLMCTPPLENARFPMQEKPSHRSMKGKADGVF